VLVMDGRETALGSHADLLARSPRYAELMLAWAPATGEAATETTEATTTSVTGVPVSASAADLVRRQPVSRSTRAS